MTHNAKIVIFDIETAPAEAYVWRRWKENIRVDQVISEGYVLCAVAKFLDEKYPRKISLPDTKQWKTNKEDDTEVVKWCWEILNDADIVVAHNGKHFDFPVLNTRFMALGLPPPAPYKIVDTLEVAKKKFKFPYNSLHGILTYLGLATKHDTDFQLWVDCKNGKMDAWKTMVDYCVNDVKILETLYKKMVPWIDTHPNMGLFTDFSRPVCPKCGSEKIHRRGTHHTLTQVYNRYSCTACGGWFRDRNTSLDKEQKKTVVTHAVT
jgi:DNA polymerase III alpha subunit (gram-positive type)